MSITTAPDVRAALANFKTAHDNAGALADPVKAQAQAQLAWMEAMTAYVVGDWTPVATAASTSETPLLTPEQLAAQAAEILGEKLIDAVHTEAAPGAPEAPATDAAPPTIQPSNAGV